MLITQWLRVRSPTCRKSCRPHHRLHKQYHSSSSLQRNVPQSPIIQPLYVDTVPPSAEQLHASEIFFKTHVPTKSWTATEWRQQPHSEATYLIPEVAFLGRSNSGKSSLLNGLLFDPRLCRVGAKPGKTITMHAWSLSPVDRETKGARKGHQGDMEPKLTVLDMPGYGHGSHGEWGAAIMKYLTARRQLRRAFVLVNPLHGMKEQDLQMLELLRSNGIPHQMIACKADRMKAAEAPVLLSAMQTQIDTHFAKKRQVPLLMTVKDILVVGGLAQSKDNFRWIESAQGLHDIRWAILRAAGLDEYATMLAANGGRPPKVKRGQSLSIDQSTSENGTAPQTLIPQPPTPIKDQYISEDLTQTSITHEEISTISISAEDLVSDIFHPMSDRSSDSELRPNGRNAKFGNTNESATRSASIRGLGGTSTSRSPGTQRVIPPKPRVRDGKLSRTKDVKRYGARNR